MNAAGARKAALAIATMHPTDRRWMLARLPKHWVSHLRPLINEARRFASIDDDALQAALDGDAITPIIEVPAPAVLIAVIDGLSVEWAARVLIGAASDHAEIYLTSCQRQRAESIRYEMARLPKAFPKALASSMARCLNDAGQILRAGEALQ